MNDSSSSHHRSQPDTARRRAWMAVLSRASRGELEAALDALPAPPNFVALRAPEPGLVMVQGRAGGTGAAFNLGEMTVTRAAVRCAAGHVGHAYVAGRDRRRAELAALFDALLQDPTQGERLAATVIAPLAAAQACRRAATAARTAATKVDFFTVARGED